VATPIADPVFGTAVDYYDITAGEFTDQLHPNLGPTTLWGYNPTGATQRHLGGVIVAARGRPVRIRMRNNLPSTHMIPIDTTIPGANQAQNRIAVHIHGGLVPWISDGGPFDWFDRNGGHGLSFQNDGVLLNAAAPFSTAALANLAGAGSADYFYPNNQSARLCWYHDHAWGITRINAYSGIATAYVITDSVEQTLIGTGALPGIGFPIVFQDKIFVSATTPVTDPTWARVAQPKVQGIGSLWYAHVYEPNRWKLLKGGATLVPPDPSVIPEFFGDTMLVNGTVYPYIPVTPGRHRFRVLNACNARFLNLNLFYADATTDGITLNARTQFPMNAAGPVMKVIGTEGGFLAQPVNFTSPKPFNPATFTGNLLLGPAERVDVLIEFTAADVGKDIILYSDAPAPFPVGDPLNDYYLGNPKNPIQPRAGTGPDTRQVLRFKVVATGTSGAIPGQLPVGPAFVSPGPDPAPIVPLPAAVVAPVPPLTPPPLAPVRDLTLNETFDAWGRLIQLIGTNVAPPGKAAGFGRAYTDPPTEVVPAGSTEVWRIFNLTGDTHPIHFHLVNVQVLSRQPIKAKSFTGVPVFMGPARGPELEELGWKETVKMHPGECTTVVMKFDLPNVSPYFNLPTSARTGGHEYVWHCHILEHEEHDMMRPLVVI
jgi:spore coat protein A